jgi:hypothetical protein
MLRVEVDFNTMQIDPRERVLINTVVEPSLLPHLHPGLPVTLFAPADMEVDAVLEFDEALQRWFGVPDWSTRRDLPSST